MIQLEHVRVVKQDTVILTDIDLSVQKGEKILLKGESGSGKSTLIKALLFFEYFQGRLLFDGEPVTLRNLCHYRRQSGYISQVIPNFSEKARDFLQIPYSFKYNKSQAFDLPKIHELLEKLNFEETVLDKKFSELSGGEKQRMIILQMLLLDKPVYLLDEVTSALDKKNICAAISLITEDKNKTVLSISHNEEWEDYCTRVLVMDKGKIVKDFVPGAKGGN